MDVFNLKESIEKQLTHHIIDSVGKYLGTHRIRARAEYNFIRVTFIQDEEKKKITIWSDKSVIAESRVDVDDVMLLFDAIKSFKLNVE